MPPPPGLEFHFMCMNISPEPMCGVGVSQKRTSDPVKLEVQVVVSGCQELNLGSLHDKQVLLNTGAFFLAPSFSFSLVILVAVFHF